MMNRIEQVWDAPREILRPRTIRRNVSSRKRPKYKVEMWKWNGKRVIHTEYQFRGEIDWSRVIKDTFEDDGAEVVRVTAMEGKLPWCEDFDGVAKASVEIVLSKHQFACLWRNDFIEFYRWYRRKDDSIPDSEIVAALIEHHKNDKPAIGTVPSTLA